MRLLWHDPSFSILHLNIHWPSTLTRTCSIPFLFKIYMYFVNISCYCKNKLYNNLAVHQKFLPRDALDRWNSRINKFRFGWMISIWTFFFLVLCQEIQNEWNFVTQLTRCRFIHDSVNFVTRATSPSDLPVIGYRTEIKSARLSLLYRISIKGLLSSGFLRILVSFSPCSA